MQGLYIHIPFCKSICHYCDFYKMVVSQSYQEKFLTYLLKDLTNTKNKYQMNSFDTIYIGGGTPSCLSDGSLELLLSKIKELFDLNKAVEYTIEVNVEDINDEKIAIFKRFGINRISIGVQSLNAKNWLILGRKTEFNELEEKVNLLNSRGFDNYSFDLIYAIPNETIEDVKSDLELLLSLNPKHISTYSLILEEKTILNYEVEHGKYQIEDDEVDLAMYNLIKDKLIKCGFHHYETSNFSKPGYESKHNQLYWNMDNYYGVGPSAASLINNIRFTNVVKMNDYYSLLDLDQEPHTTFELMDKQQMMSDFVMLGLRKIEGINIIDFENRYQENIFEVFSNTNSLIKNGSLLKKENQIMINPKYLYIANHIISKMII